ncbi:hypothetical protein [Paucisalibacillus globulus]|jgi:hypothetical protein|uniref:hypothetical protein n=1 Tax=Paucisalibacillus globulus TaxID=351095 RepID=UPI0004145499|nr:hypothetical protein [Paucisalibacillus globulus]
MKIDSNIKRRDLSQKFKEHLLFVDIINVKSSVVTVILVLYDLPLAAGLLSIYKLEFLWILMPFIIILHLWGIRLLVKNPYSTQFETIRFIGTLGVIGTLTFFIIANGMSIFAFHINSILYYGLINLSLLITSYILVKYQIDKYSGDPTKEGKKHDQSKYMGLLSVSPAIGYLLALSTKGNSTLQLAIMMIMIFFLILLYVYVAAKFIHRYYFMKTNIDIVILQTPTKKEYKELREKGVEIK